MIEPGWNGQHRLDVAQEYISLYLINNTKFDLRIYALIASISPLRIYVFRDGIARFCSEDNNSNSMYSRLTNVNFNIHNTGVDFSKISRLISEVFPIVESDGVNINDLWSEIYDAITLTILAAHRYLAFSEKGFIKPCGYPRCFQILGFDILLDHKAHPWVLEVNYRPLLDFHRPAERRMKTRMVADAIRLAAPLDLVQEVLNERKGMDEDFMEWERFMGAREDLQTTMMAARQLAEVTGGFERAWPPMERARFEMGKKILLELRTARMECVPGFMNPMAHVKGGES